MRLTILAPPDHVLYRDPSNIAVSPDGRRIAFLTGSSRSSTRLWIRALDSLDVREVESSQGAVLPFWSPDSTRLGFFAQGKLKTVTASGGRPQILADAPDGRGATWGARGDIVFAAAGAGALMRVSANGGPVTATTELRPSEGETAHRFPVFLPDGRHFLFAALPSKDQEYPIYAGSVDAPGVQLLLTAETAPVFATSGHLVYSRRGVLVAHPFDADSRRLTGEALPMGDTPGEMNLEFSSGHAVSVSATGSLVYLAAAQSKARLVWLDQTGRETSTINVPPGPYIGVSLSHDEQRAVVQHLSAPHASLWFVDLVRGGLTPLTPSTAWNSNAVWSPDDRRVVYGNDRKGPVDMYIRPVGTSDDEVLYQSAALFKYPVSWSDDGRTIVFSNLSPETSADLWTFSIEDRKPKPFLQTKANEPHGVISPSGHWIAYVSNEAGAFDVYVQPFPGGGSPHRVTTGGTLDWGVWWKKDERQLLIVDAERNLLLVDVTTRPGFSVSTPRVVGRLRFTVSAEAPVAATKDLSRLLAAVPEQTEGARSITVVLNWPRAVSR
jgi:Tol biopolymer transport system component